MRVALETISTRDALWEDMSAQTHPVALALWTDLTPRLPAEVRVPASMLGFSSWLRGDGARACCVLDQVPADRPYFMAAIVASTLQNGLQPQEWERHKTQLRERRVVRAQASRPQPAGRPAPPRRPAGSWPVRRTPR